MNEFQHEIVNKPLLWTIVFIQIRHRKGPTAERKLSISK